MKKLNFFVLLICTFFMTSCAVVESMWNQITDPGPLDNDGSTYHVYSQNEAIDRVMNTREAQAWNSSAASRGLLLASTGINIVENFTGQDLSKVREIIDATTDDLVADKNSSKSDVHSLVGVAFYGAGRVAGHFEDKQKAKSNTEFRKLHKDEQNFDCRYKINPKTGYFEDIQKRYGMDSVMRCIWGQQEEDYRLMLDSAVRECAPFEELDDLLTKTGDEKIDNHKHKVLYDALRCFNAMKREMQSSTYMTSSENENLGLSQELEDLLESTTPTESIQSNGDNDNVVPSNSLSDDELLESIKTSDYKFNSYALSEENKAELDKAAEILLRNPEWEIELLGHSCDFGDKEAKYIIGIQRAKVAKQYLVEKGVDAKHIYVHSYADKKPVVPNNSVENRSANRRVEIKIIK